MNSHSRHLAAILFTGMQVSVSDASGEDAEWLRLRHLFHEIVQTMHTQYGGRVVNFFGNGSISVFNCTLDAVRCAQLMQQELRASGLTVSMGLHIGEVIDEAEDISGACVNIASRILDLSIPGSVILTDIVYAQIRNQPEFRVRSLGKFALKNIGYRVPAFALKDKRLVVPSRLDILRARKSETLSHWLLAPVHALILCIAVVRTTIG